MKSLIRILPIALVCLLATACVMKPYEPPQSGKTATVVFDGARMPTVIPFFERRLNVNLYDKCFDGHPNVDGALGYVLIHEEDFFTKEVVIPAEKPIFLSYGVGGSCMVNWGFTPEDGQAYRAEYDSTFGGCRGGLVKTKGDAKVPGLKFYKLTTWEAAVGAGDAWRSCDNIDR